MRLPTACFLIVAAIAAVMLPSALAEEDGFTACSLFSDVSTPSNFQEIHPGVPITIRWSPSSISATNVEIQLWELDPLPLTDVQVDTITTSTSNSGSFTWTPSRYSHDEGNNADFYLYFVSKEANDKMRSFCFYIVYDITTKTVSTDTVLAVVVQSKYATAFEVELWSVNNPSHVVLGSRQPICSQV